MTDKPDPMIDQAKLREQEESDRPELTAFERKHTDHMKLPATHPDKGKEALSRAHKGTTLLVPGGIPSK